MAKASATFTEWLYRPYIDLGELQSTGNPQTHSLMVAAKDLQSETVSNTRVHGICPPSLRRAILKSLGKPEYFPNDLGDLRADLQTDTWKALVRSLDQYNHLSHIQRMKTLWLLHKMSLHDLILRCETRPADRSSLSGVPEHDHAHEMDRAYMRGLANVAIQLDGGAADLSDLEFVDLAAAPGSWAHIEATYALAQVNLKELGDSARAKRALATHRASIERSGAEGHERNKLLSRFHRIFAFLPQLEGDHDGMTRQMEMAQELCDRMGKKEDNDYAEWNMLWYGVMESRVKEFLLRGDLSKALFYAEGLVQHAPSDPRARMELGQVLIERNDLPGAVDAYRCACLLGPQVRSIGEYMIGQCLEQMDRPVEARDAYMRSIDSDPLAISSVERLVSLIDIEPGEKLKAWARSRLADLEASQDIDDRSHELQQYQVYDGQLGRAEAVAAIGGV
jgi:tetratricopeptide (TPR) repeat protein